MHFYSYTQHWKMLYSSSETFLSALRSFCDLLESENHLSDFPREGWKSLFSPRLHSLLNLLTHNLLQGQKQQQQPGKDSNSQLSIQWDKWKGDPQKLHPWHGQHVLQRNAMALKYSESYPGNIRPNSLLARGILHVTIDQSHCLVFAVYLTYEGYE